MDPRDVLIVWDCQNVRLPRQLRPRDFLLAMYETYVRDPGRRCCGMVSCFTDGTKAGMGHSRFNQLTNNGVLNVTMINAAGKCSKTSDTDHPLREAMASFTVEKLLSRRRGAIVLVTGDADFVRPAVWCRQQGCIELHVMYYGGNAAGDIRSLHAESSTEFTDFLDRTCAGAATSALPWTFDYPPVDPVHPCSSANASKTKRRVPLLPDMIDMNDASDVSDAVDLLGIGTCVPCATAPADPFRADRRERGRGREMACGLGAGLLAGLAVGLAGWACSKKGGRCVLRRV
jgi:hypothetical protein